MLQAASKSKRRGIAVLCALPFLLLVAASCTSSSSKEETGNETLVIAARKIPDGIDADVYFNQEDQVIRNAANSFLLTLPRVEDASGVVIPDYENLTQVTGDLAESWDVSEDGLTLTVKLRQGVMSHAGNELTADDIQYTWNRSWALEGVGAFYGKFTLGLTEPTWKVVDKYTWQISTLKPNSALVPLFTNNDLIVLDSKEVKKHTTDEDPWASEWLATNEAGFGPYRIVEWSPGNRVVLEAFDGYHGEAPFFKRVIYRAVPDASQRAALVQSGAAQVAENVNYRDLQAMQDNPDVTVWDAPGNRTFWITLNEETPPFDDVRVRQALMYATPVDQILEGVYFGFGTPLTSPLVAGYPYSTSEFMIYDYDPNKARQLLKDAGASDLSFTIHYDSGRDNERDVGAILKSAWSDVGVDVEIQGDPSSSFFTNAFGGKFDAFFEETATNTPDPGYALGLTFPCNGTFNLSNYCDPHVDKLLEEGYATPNGPKREEIYREVQRILVADNPPVVYLLNSGFQLVTQASIGGVVWDPSNIEVIALLAPAE
jgi:peptide/nickel transport system substrate-binding protein